MTRFTPPSDCASMPMLRREIDALDRHVIGLLARRAAYIDRAIALKQENGWPARIPDRVEEVVANARSAAEAEGLDPALVEGIWRSLIDWSIEREAQVIPVE